MKNRIENRLNTMIEWLEKDSINYTKDDFKKELDRMLDALDETLWCEILTDKEYTTLRDMIIRKAIKCLQKTK